MTDVIRHVSPVVDRLKEELALEKEDLLCFTVHIGKQKVNKHVEENHGIFCDLLMTYSKSEEKQSLFFDLMRGHHKSNDNHRVAVMELPIKHLGVPLTERNLQGKFYWI